MNLKLIRRNMYLFKNNELLISANNSPQKSVECLKRIETMCEKQFSTHYFTIQEYTYLTTQLT